MCIIESTARPLAHSGPPTKTKGMCTNVQRSNGQGTEILPVIYGWLNQHIGAGLPRCTLITPGLPIIPTGRSSGMDSALLHPLVSFWSKPR